MREQYIEVDEYTTIVLEREDDEEELEPEELLTILDENDIRCIENNRRNQIKSTIYLR